VHSWAAHLALQQQRGSEIGSCTCIQPSSSAACSPSAHARHELGQPPDTCASAIGHMLIRAADTCSNAVVPAHAYTCNLTAVSHVSADTTTIHDTCRVHPLRSTTRRAC
jgi:hypothetical protein